MTTTTRTTSAGTEPHVPLENTRGQHSSVVAMTTGAVDHCGHAVKDLVPITSATVLDCTRPWPGRIFAWRRLLAVD